MKLIDFAVPLLTEPDGSTITVPEAVGSELKAGSLVLDTDEPTTDRRAGELQPGSVKIAPATTTSKLENA